MKYHISNELPNDIAEVVEGSGKCIVCGETTSYTEISYQCWMCSSECLGEMDKGYYAALTGRNHPDNSALVEVVKELVTEVHEMREDIAALDIRLQDIENEQDM